MKKAGINLIEVKERNRALLLQSVCTAGSITRSELSEGLHLSPMTVTNITSELLQKHIIEEFAPQDPIKSPGRTPMLLRICSTSPVVLGIYISRTCLYGVVCDLSLQLLARAKRPLTPIENEESFLQKLRELAEQLTEHTERPILGMGISTVGVISSDASGIAYVTDFFGIRSLNLRDALQPYFRFPIIVCNDMHASGLCELYFGAGKDADSFLYMGITEGLGAALVSHHELLDACGELGHTSIDFGGPRCTCGSRGCLELYASAPAILSLIHDECGVELDSMEQAAGFAMTNKAAYTVFYNAMRQLSFGLNNYLNLVNVSLVRVQASTVGVTEVTQKKDTLTLQLESLELPMIRGLLVAFNGRVTAGAGNRPYLSVTLQPDEKPLELLQSILKAMAEILASAEQK